MSSRKLLFSKHLPSGRNRFFDGQKNRFERIQKKVLTSFALISLVMVAFPCISNAEIQPQKIQVLATASKKSVQVAEPLLVRLKLVATEHDQVIFPPEPSTAGDFEVLKTIDRMGIPTAKGREYTRTMTLETLQSGQLTIPSFPVTIRKGPEKDSKRQTLLSEPINIRVTTQIAESDDPTKFKDIKSVVFLEETSPEHNTFWAVWISLGAFGITFAMIMLALTFYWKRLSPKQKALRDLNQLQESDSLSEQTAKHVYHRTTGILREFIQAQFDIPATTQTTEEFLIGLTGSLEISEQLQIRLGKFLNAADLVKFAGHTCNQKDLCEAIEQARRFVIQADEYFKGKRSEKLRENNVTKTRSAREKETPPCS